MPDPALPALVGLLIVIEFLAAVACYSLRDFSRSRLDEICRRHNNELRFGLILKRYERALLAVELFFTIAFVALAAGLVQWLGVRPDDPAAEGWTTLTIEWIGILAVLFFALVILPWTVARVWGEAFLYRFWPLIGGLHIFFRPLVSVSLEIDKALHRVGGLEVPNGDDASALTEEIRTVVDEGQRGGILESEARTMIHRVMELQEEDVAAVMTPRTDMVSINADATLAEARQKLLEAGHSRIPVIGESTDDILGLLYAKDLLKHLDVYGADAPLHDVELRDPIYVPETTGIDKLLEDLKRTHVHLAIVLDEYGGVAGLVTMEDVLEEIVGEIVDEYDVAEAEPIQQIEPGIMEVDARVHIDDLNERFDFDLPEDSDYDTVGGFVFSHLGRIPEAGETFLWNQLRFVVLEADKRKLVKLRIEVDQSAAALADE